jgi:hypothetical protein
MTTTRDDRSERTTIAAAYPSVDSEHSTGQSLAERVRPRLGGRLLLGPDLVLGDSDP